MYREIKEIDDSISKYFIERLSDNAFIPMSEKNTDYQEYLKWLKVKGNKPEPA